MSEESSFSTRKKPYTKIDYPRMAYWFEKIYTDKVSSYGYKVTPSDISSLKRIALTFRKMSYNPEIHLKRFLEWAVENREMIISEKGYFILAHLGNYINHYIQYYVSEYSKKEIHANIPYDKQFVPTIRKNIDNSMSFKDLLLLYGIPIISTYLYRKMGKQHGVIRANVKKIMHNLCSESPEIAIEIIRKSVMLAPYPEEFEMLNWRDEIAENINKLNIIKNNWWMKNDYQGIPPKHYEEVLEWKK